MRIASYSIGEELSVCSFFRVFRAKTIPDGNKVLIKAYSETDFEFRDVDPIQYEQISSLSLTGSNHHVLKVLEVIDEAKLKGIAYEFFDGITLKEFLHDNALPVDVAIQIALNLIDAVDSIHQDKMVLNNMNPMSILISPDSLEIKLFDLSQASKLTTPYEVQKATGRNLDFHYISPEATGRLQYSKDHRSDYYSLGVILYEMITGNRPFTSLEPQELAHSHIARKPAPPISLIPKCPQKISDLILKLLSKPPSNRYQSRVGIQYDLNYCLKNRTDIDLLNKFELGGHDFFADFSIPNVFFGHHAELSILERSLKHAVKGKGSIITIKGPAGVGKTSLVQEFIKRTSHPMLYAKGKFNQQKDTYPYSAFIQVMESLGKYVLSETEHTFKRFQIELQKKLNSHADIITNMAPSFLSILEDTTAPLLLGPAEAKNRFEEAIISFFSVFTSMAPPIIILLDDLQWADIASLNLLSKLFDAQWSQKMILISCYRQDEVTDVSMLSALLDDLQKRVPLVEISMAELPKEATASLVASTLQSDIDSVHDLTDYIYKASGGNALYVHQLLSNMHLNGLIWVDVEEQRWCWNIPHSDDHIYDPEQGILNLLKTIISSLNPKQLELLKYGASMGNSFDVNKIAYVLELTKERVIRRVASMANQNLVFINGDYISFHHNRIQQVLMLSIDNDEACKIHLKIGKRLFKQAAENPVGERLLEITDHLTRAKVLLQSNEELEMLLKLNYQSAHYTIHNSAYEIALNFSSIALELLNKLLPKVSREMEFNVRLEHVRCLYLNAQYQQARSEAENILATSETLSQKMKCYAVFKDIIVSEGSDFSSAINVGLTVLRQEGAVSFDSEAALLLSIEEKKQQINHLMEGKSPSDLFKYKQLDNERQRNLLILFTHLWEAAYYNANKPLMDYSTLSAVALSIEHGNASESSFAYALYGMILTLEHKYREAFDYCELALDLNDEFHDKVMLPKVTNLVCNYVSFHIEPFERSVKLYEKSCVTGQKNGDNLFGLWAAIFVIWSQLLANRNLSQVLITVDKLRNFIERTHDTKMIYVHGMLENVIRSLIGEDSQGQPVELNNQDLYIDYWRQNHFSPGITWHAILVGQYYCINGEYEKAYDLLNQDDLTTSVDIVMFPHTQYVFFKTLALLKLIERGTLSLTISHDKAINDNINIITTWAENCPDNFLSQQLILQAEKAKSEDKQWDAALLYSKAIGAGTQYNNSSNLALCYELAGEFWQDSGDFQLYEYHLRRSAACYSGWGAKHKAKTILSRLSSGDPISTNDTHDQSVTRDKTSLVKLGHGDEFDLYSVAKFTQAISEEIEETNLTTKTMEIILESAGADKGALITVSGDALIVNVLADLRKNDLTIQNISKPVDEIENLPRHIIHYVQRSNEALTLNTLGFDETEQDAEYIEKNQVKCLCCLPVHYKEKLVAILYLENKSTESIFSDSRIRILQVILSQLAISLQTATLYQSLNKEIEQHRKTELELKISEDRLRLSYQYSNLGVWDWDMNTDELTWSGNVAPMFGGPEGEMNTSFESFMQAIHPDDRQLVIDALEKCRGGETYRVEHRVVWADGTIRWIMETGDIMRDEYGQGLRMLGVIRDITELKRKEDEQIILQNQLQQAQKMETIGELTGGIAHDFNNILGSILGYAELMENNTDNKDSHTNKNYLEKIIISGKRASALVAQMLAFSRTNDLETTTVDINEVIEETITMLHSMMPTSIKLIHKMEIDIPNVLANQVQLNQVIMNLCINARDAYGGRGDIIIAVGHHRSISGICSSCFSPINGEFIEFSVQDTAGGIPPSMAKDIFTPFFTTKNIGDGSGMGLSMVHGIVHSSSGHIILESEEGQGTKFRIFLPTTTHKTEESDVHIIQEENDENELAIRILVVDDVVEILNITKIVFESLGCKVTTCSNSSDALHLIQTELDSFDLMIADQTMPDVLGTDLVKAASKINPSFPVILCTGYSSSLNKEVADRLSINELLQKPVLPSELIKTVKEVMAK